MKIPTLFVVVRQTGSYDEYRTAAIAWFSERGAAKAFARACNDAIPELRERHDRWCEHQEKVGWTGKRKPRHRIDRAADYDSDLNYGWISVPKGLLP